MPSDAVGFSATLYFHPDVVRILAGRFEAEYRRLSALSAERISLWHHTTPLRLASANPNPSACA